MSCNFVNPAPIGVNIPITSARRPIYRVNAGDAVCLMTRTQLHDGAAAAPDNSIVNFELHDQRFSCDSIWKGAWGAGVSLLDDDITQIEIPQDVINTLRRGSFLFSMTVTDLEGAHKRTVLCGSLLVEYQPTSPHRDIPYKR